ncbi:hypothetical protein [Polaromonas sp.]|uniref:hypothetical protein n=1 Tax=Polaromonas sp. TaxID=1869339 RepID=UPI002FCBE4FE
MRLKLNQAGEQGKQGRDVSEASNPGIHELDKQRLRILRCTAQAMVSSPGGLRFKAGARPWLDGLPGGRHGAAVSQATGD